MLRGAERSGRRRRARAHEASSGEASMPDTLLQPPFEAGQPADEARHQQRQQRHREQRRESEPQGRQWTLEELLEREVSSACCTVGYVMFCALSLSLSCPLMGQSHCSGTSLGACEFPPCCLAFMSCHNCSHSNYGHIFSLTVHLALDTFRGAVQCIW